MNRVDEVGESYADAVELADRQARERGPRVVEIARRVFDRPRNRREPPDDFAPARGGHRGRRIEQVVDGAESLVDVETGVPAPGGVDVELPGDPRERGAEQPPVDVSRDEGGRAFEPLPAFFKRRKVRAHRGDRFGRPIRDPASRALDAGDIVAGDRLMDRAPRPEVVRKRREIILRRGGGAGRGDDQRKREHVHRNVHDPRENTTRRREAADSP